MIKFMVCISRIMFVENKATKYIQKQKMSKIFPFLVYFVEYSKITIISIKLRLACTMQNFFLKMSKLTLLA